MTEEIKDKIRNITLIHSDNDSDVPIKFANEIKEKFKADLILEHNKGHISESDGVRELPSLLNSILKPINSNLNTFP